MLAGTTIKLMQEIISIVEEGRNAGLESENIVNNIFNRAIMDRDIVVVEGSEERPLHINEIAAIARKAVEQAQFDGGFIVLSSGYKIIVRKSWEKALE